MKEGENLKESLALGDSSNEGNSLLNIDRKDKSFSKY